MPAYIKATVWLTRYGVQSLASGQELDANSFSLCCPDLDMEPEGWHKVTTIDIVPPPRKPMVALAVAALDKQEETLREQWQGKLNELYLMRSKLLAIEAPASGPQSVFSDLDDADRQQLEGGAL